VILALALVAGCAPVPGGGPGPDQGIDPNWRYAGKAGVVLGRNAVVVSGHPRASEVGQGVLARGGNAVDAAVAVGFALAVVHPESGNIGGGGYLVLRLPGGEAHSLDFREAAPARATRDMFLDSAGNFGERSTIGHLSAGVPGTVAGLAEAHRRFGKLPWRDLVDPAVRLAGEGFTIDAYRSRSLAAAAGRLARFPATAAIFLPGGRPPAPGSRLVQPELAQTLAAIRDGGASGFYAGRVATLLVEEMRRGGGLISLDDLAAYRPIWREPLVIRYRNHTILSMAPSSSGGVTLALILNMMEGWSRLPAFGSPRLMHLQAEVMRRAFIDRNRWLGDPAFVSMPLERLLSKEYAQELRRQIDDDRATPTPPFVPTPPDRLHTTHYSVVDSAGTAVSVTTTINRDYGSAVTVAGAGFLLNDEMDDFTTAPGRPNFYGLVQGEANAVAAGKRMLSAMTPAIVLDPGHQVLLVLGTPGGSRIPTQVFQVISNVIDHRMGLPDAVTMPRMHHQSLPDEIQADSAGFLPSTLEALRRMGHTVQSRPIYGDIQAIIRLPGGWQGVSDPRRGGGGAAY
jgi:gamma-glutamyltranspeptidase/glutathione hydrolase